MNFEIYSKDNILRNLDKMRERIKSNFKEEYSTSDLFYGFNGLTYEEQDKILKPNKTKREELDLEVLYNEIRCEAKKCKEANIVGVKLLIKNPEYQEFKRKNSIKKKRTTLSEDVNRLLRNGLMTLDEVLDNDFSDDEKQIIKMKYSEEPPLNSTAVSLRLCIDQEEVSEATVKFYNETIAKHKKKLVLKGGSND